jgi:hypothetical protein
MHEVCSGMDYSTIRRHSSACWWLFAVMVIGTSCGGADILAPGFITGSWRGDSWGLEADAAPARLHYICGGAARVHAQLRWSNDLTFEGTAEFPWNSVPDGPDLVFTGRALTSRMLELDVGPPGGVLDTLRRASSARFPLTICD